MIDQAYTSQEEVEAYTLTTVAEQFLDQLDRWIAAASAYVMQQSGRQLLADSAASVRVFDGNGSDELLIDDCVQVTKLEVGNDSYGSTFTEVAAGGASGYITLPNNAAALGVPIRKLKCRGYDFTCGEQNHRVTAKWGAYATLPADIRFAATVLVAGMMNAARKDVGTIQSERIGNYSVSYASAEQLGDFARVREIIAQYRRIEL